ncbi:fluoride efflux transporter CrcB [Streptacidiphilus pinicola]|uniref:Fluoride-specific ion channel FluC n=1 Tax=Streptacidiphilus pinicola TaxID=2219663 RepID=A0A2X0K0U1_9ACTN|nr:fluoride efflux transporter CrcB [Streptacidiphilus pinicola]RAG82875.1 fluoride efflux transporter CrcB [Streptacidiphilus pinicola]
MAVLLVFLGGMLGAPLRYLTDRAMQARHDSVFPWGTFTVNVVGSFVLGAIAAGVARLGWPNDLALAVGTGVCGGLTTFSTFGYETVRLLTSGAVRYAALNVLGSLAAGLAAASAGWALVSAF